MTTAKTFEKAIMYSLIAHKGQKRKGDGRPYITHPFSVVWRVHKYKKSTNPFLLATVAVLHDTKEDCKGVKIKTIAKKFGHDVAALVKELTLNKKLYEKYGKTQYLIRTMMKMSSYALVIKLCDRLDNVCDMKEMPKAFINRYKKETTDILKALLDENTGRKLTNTHLKIIEKIDKELNKYE